MFSELKDCTIGSTFEDRFVIDAVLGKGGMGCVYRATHTLMGKPVALKVLQGSVLQDAQLRERFLREIKAASALDHPNIIKTLASGVTQEGCPWVAMELVEGQTLSQIIESERALNVQRARPLLQQIAAGLQAAHEQGIIHRDIKPSNVLVTTNGGNERALIVDFGLAKEITRVSEGGQNQTKTAMQGSPLYMSPEQCEAKRTDPRTDVYSFGCLMHELLTGKPPFQGESAYEVLLQHVHEEIPQVDKNIPEELRAIIDRCLQKDPAARFADGTELSAALAGGDFQRSAKHQAITKGARKPIDAKTKFVLGGILALLAIPTSISVASEYISRDTDTTRKVAAQLDRLGLYSMEASLLDQCAAKLPKFDHLPQVDDIAMKGVPLEEQLKPARYYDMRTAAALAKLKADPQSAESEVRSLLREMIDFTSGSGVRQNVWMNMYEAYDPIVEDACRLALTIPGIGDRAFDKRGMKDLETLAKRAIVRGVWTRKDNPLTSMGIDIYSLMLKGVIEDDKVLASAYYHLVFAYLSKAHLAKDPSERLKLVELAEEANTKEYKFRQQMLNYPGFLIATAAKQSVFEYARGKPDLAEQIIREEYKRFEARPRRRRYKPADEDAEQECFRDALSLAFDAYNHDALMWCNERLAGLNVPGRPRQ
jgi:serine/threonine protein kinase